MARRSTALVVLGLALTAVPASLAADDHCWSTPVGVQCNIEGTIPIDPGDGTTPPGERPPIRYLILDTDLGGADCYWWSRVPVPGAIDTWDPANDPLTIITLLNTPACVSVAAATVTPADRAWEVYRSWTLQVPAPEFSPPDFGITGLPSYVGVTAASLDYRETLPGGIDLIVSAEVTAVTIDWGDGTAQRYSLTETAPYPAGIAAHTYDLKTCTADYRENDPSGHLCHPALDAYPVTVTFTWTAGYRYDAGWIELESVDLSSTVAYDVDEVVAVPSG